MIFPDMFETSQGGGMFDKKTKHKFSACGYHLENISQYLPEYKSNHDQVVSFLLVWCGLYLENIAQYILLQIPMIK
jgi:hypothetical protein